MHRTYALIGSTAKNSALTSLQIGSSQTESAARQLIQVAWSAGKILDHSSKCLSISTLPSGNVENTSKVLDWANILSAGVGHLFLQPFAHSSGMTSDDEERCIRAARVANPQVKPWIFAAWPGQEWGDDPLCTGWQDDEGATSPSWNPPCHIPKNWEEALFNKMAYYRQTLSQWNEKAKGQEPARLCPVGPALLNLKNEIETGQVPGMDDLFSAVFADNIHLNPKGEYLIACVQFACLFSESPLGKVNPAGTGLNVEQARIFERVAWDTVTNEPESGHAPKKDLWYSAAGSPHPTVPFEFYSPSVTVTVTHSHADDEPSVHYASGMLINRHVWPKRHMAEYKLITRDSLGRDEAPYGTDLPLALFPKWKDNTWGGELLDEVNKNDGRTLHQIQWDFVAKHVNKAYDHYIMQHQDIWPDELNDLEFRKDLVDRELTPELLESAHRGLTDFQKFIAIANYASAWQCRTNKGGRRCSVHGVDVMQYGHNCGGTSKIFMQMFTVAGLKVRMLGWNCHMSSEVKVGKKWIFSDMILRDGAECRSTHSWAELSADPDVYPTAVLSFMRDPVARETNYLHAQGMYWNSIGGIDQYNPEFSHQGSVLGMEYLPNLASALYPSMRLHIWHIKKGELPSLVLCKEGSGRKNIAFKAGMAARKHFWLSACQDNPIQSAKASFSINGKVDSLHCTLDGHELERIKGAQFALPIELLTPGEHELILHNTGTEQTELRFYPDLVRPYLNPVKGEPIEITVSRL